MNIALAMMRIFPNANPLNDFEVVDEGEGPEIRKWNVKDDQGNPVPQPTEAQLLAAWKAYQENPPTPPKPIEEQLQETKAELAAAKAQLNQQAQASADQTLLILDLYEAIYPSE